MKKIAFALLLPMLAANPCSFGQSNEIQDGIAIIKKNLSDSKESIKKYEWIETTTTFVDGEQKSVKQNQCYYSVDGQLTKVATGATTVEKKKGGLRGKIAENKKEEMKEYIEAALKKIKGYIPPQAEKIQKIYADGKVGIQILEPGKKFRFDFPNYLEAGDKLSISLDKEHKLLKAYEINTFVEGPKDPVSLSIVLNTLPDGTTYASEIAFNSAAEKVKIVMKNSGFKVGAGH